MKVWVVPSDREAPGYYRLGLPAMTLMDQGEPFEFTFVEGLPMVDAKGAPAIPGVTKPVALHPEVECDLLILQRPMAPYQLLALETAQARGIRVVVEVDDDLHAVDRRSAFGSQLRGEHLRVFEECAKRADLVTVSTPALAAKYGSHGRVVVLRNYVPEAWLSIEADFYTRHDYCRCNECRGHARAPSDHVFQLVVGWTGSVGNHVDDLTATRGGVGAALRATGDVFRCFGQGNSKSRAQIEHAMGGPVEIFPWQSREYYPHEIAQLDVGIAPLLNTTFNRAKSWLKPLEYAALGVPCVMSPTDEYRKLHDDYGIGVLANFHSPAAWRREVERLLSDDEHRAETGNAAREAVRESLTMEANSYRWAEAWAGVLAIA